MDRDTPGLQSLQSHSLATGSCKSCCGIKGPWSLCLATQKDLPWHLLYCPDKQGNCALGWDCLLVPLSPFKSLLKCPSVRGLSQPPFIKGPVPSPPSLCSMGFTPQGQGLCFCSLLHRELRTVPGAEQTLHRYTFVELNERSGSGKLLEVYTNTNNSKCNLGINRW